jgi:hypothetical protein
MWPSRRELDEGDMVYILQICFVLNNFEIGKMKNFCAIQYTSNHAPGNGIMYFFQVPHPTLQGYGPNITLFNFMWIH